MTKEPRPEENPTNRPDDLPKEKEKRVGWIEGLAKRSTGLPKPISPSRQEPEKSPWSYAGIGIQFAATTALFFGMGWYVDWKFGWSPWATVGFTMLGVIGGLYLLIKDAIKNNADPTPESRKKAKDGK